MSCFSASKVKRKKQLRNFVTNFFLCVIRECVSFKYAIVALQWIMLCINIKTAVYPAKDRIVFLQRPPSFLKRWPSFWGVNNMQDSMHKYEKCQEYADSAEAVPL